MSKTMIVCLAAGLVVGVLGQNAWSNSRTTDPLGVAVAPQMLLLSMDQGGVVNVHTAIPYGSVATATVTLNGLRPLGTRSDSRGNLVADFAENDVKNIVSSPVEIMTLSGMLLDDTNFSGSDTVTVRP